MVNAQSKAVNYLGIQSPISFGKKTYNLAWSSHPTAAYYKHEYLQGGENLTQFKSMILLEALSGPANLADIVAAKVNELKGMQKTNPMVQYETFTDTKTGEYMLDFLLTANAPDGKPTIAERNVYRYKKVTNKDGKTGVLLFGVSNRSYDKEIASFLTNLKTTRKTLVNEVAQFSMPSLNF